MPDSVANQIAAGEVVNRPASVVKELMENAVDAGATTVTVNFRDGGRELIQIKDDGVGMTPQDARLAFERHATSKISSVEDIYSLVTFGFRGEALASIAAVAQVEMHTRTAGEDVGTRLVIEGGVHRDSGVVATAPGTQIFVRNLFYNVPARKKFLDKGSHESGYVLAEFQRAALAHPEVGFQLFRDDVAVYNLPAGTLHQRVVGVAGKALGGKLLEVGVQTSIATVRGFIGSPDSARKRMREQFLFVNGRFFKNVFFHRAILKAYDKLIPFGVQPSYFIYLEIDPDQIDVNVHPQKTEVKFANHTAVWQIINATVRETLAKSGAVPMMDFDDEFRGVDIPTLGSSPVVGVDFSVREPLSSSLTDYNPFEYASEGSGFLPSGDIFDGVPEVEDSVGFSDVVPLGEGYVAARFGGRFVAVDLRRAREAVLFDRLQGVVGGGGSVTQSLLFVERMVFSVEDYELLRDSLGEFEGFGFELRLGDDLGVEVLGVPAEIGSVAVDELVYGMLDALREGVEGGEDGEERRRRTLAAVLARSGARGGGGGGFSVAETGVLLEALAGVANFSFTPSGKAVMVEITLDEIRKKLG